MEPLSPTEGNIKGTIIRYDWNKRSLRIPETIQHPYKDLVSV
jgi:hypothetical protein